MGLVNSTDSGDTKPNSARRPNSRRPSVEPCAASISPPTALPIAKSNSIESMRESTSFISVSPSDSASRTEDPEALVPTVLNWGQGGSDVYVTGTFNGWKERIPLHKSQKDFTTIQYLPPGVHQYKFIVDGKWRHASDQPVAADDAGNLVNCMEVKKQAPLGVSQSPFGDASPPGQYNQVAIHESKEWSTASPGYRKEPPTLPPQLQRALLNSAPVNPDDPVLLPLPHHVMINHMYFLSRPEDPKENVEVLGTTHRFRSKFVTTVLYKPKNDTATHAPSSPSLSSSIGSPGQRFVRYDGVRR